MKKTNSQTIGGLYGITLRTGSRGTAVLAAPRRRSRPADSSRARAATRHAEQEPDEHQDAEQHRYAEPATHPTRTLRFAVAVHPDVHDGVLVRAVPTHADVELSLRPSVRRVRPDATARASLKRAVSGDVPVERPPEARVGGPAVAIEVRDHPAAPAPADLLVVAIDHDPRVGSAAWPVPSASGKSRGRSCTPPTTLQPRPSDPRRCRNRRSAS